MNRFIHIRRVCRNTKTNTITYSDRFYITDLYEIDASFYQKGIRDHWKIENSLHWVKDVIHNEDDNRIHRSNGPVNCSVISTIAINIQRTNFHWSITESQEICISKFKELFLLIRT